MSAVTNLEGRAGAEEVEELRLHTLQQGQLAPQNLGE